MKDFVHGSKNIDKMDLPLHTEDQAAVETVGFFTQLDIVRGQGGFVSQHRDGRAL